jgi:hypothetical protein
MHMFSCHGVKSTPYALTGFADSEFVVYDTDQQRIDYVLQFQLLALRHLLLHAHHLTTPSPPAGCRTTRPS